MVISSLRSIDLRFIDDLVDFVQGPGFALDFSYRSFSGSFSTGLEINIDDPKYAANGGSKGKPPPYFLQNCDDATAVRALTPLWEHRSEYLTRFGASHRVAIADARYRRLIDRLSNAAVTQRRVSIPQPAGVHRQTMTNIKADLLACPDRVARLQS